MNQLRKVTLGLMAGLISAGACASVAHAQAAAPSHVAVINLRLVYSQMAETDDTMHQLKGMQEQLDLKVKQDQDTLREMQQKIEANYKPGTPQHEQAMADFDAKSLELQQAEQSDKVKMVRTQARQMFHAYNEITAAVKDIAQKKGIDLVLVTAGQDLPPNAMDIANPETLANAIFGRNVVYVGDKIDVSDEVKANLDAAFKAGGGAVTPKPATPPATPTGH